MDLFKSLQESIRANEAEAAELREFETVVEIREAGNLFHLNEIAWGGAKKKKEEESQARIARAKARSTSGRVADNRDAQMSGGVMGSGRLAELVKLYGPPSFDNGSPPRKPEGMSPEDYKIWIDGHSKERKASELGDAIGPGEGDFIRANGELYQVTGTSGLASIVNNAEGKKIKVSWNKLGPAKEVDGKHVYTLMGS